MAAAAFQGNPNRNRRGSTGSLRDELLFENVITELCFRVSGDDGVGKCTLVKRMFDPFGPEYDENTYILRNPVFRVIPENNERVLLTIEFDPSELPEADYFRYESIIVSLSCIVFCMDLNDEDQAESIFNRIEFYNNRYGSFIPPYLLVGTKLDKRVRAPEGTPCITFAQGQVLSMNVEARAYNEVSAWTTVGMYHLQDVLNRYVLRGPRSLRSRHHED
ncbi:hypothetical protein NPIL_339741 [Nephila pilipes]|uniref:Uncharacterized protein n=1 Tax=Nephila pilipes TaxID=299642 RepID=A0A8X6MMD8_NEPPI|nr:hypothetical protein NPIL_339741 [Nephila pilipes]